jgi:hypothetical protein
MPAILPRSLLAEELPAGGLLAGSPPEADSLGKRIV